MAKFALECPKCGTINTASNFLFAKKVIHCGSCNQEINVKESRLISKKCPHCSSTFIYDQANNKKRNCPICGKPVDALNAATVTYKMTSVNCPQCACAIEVDHTKPIAFCPICDCRIEVQKELEKAKLVKDTGVSVIQYEGDNSTFVWKHPIEDFNLGTQLIVHESQEAIFFLNGEALDTFGPGRHTLETENLPVLKKLYPLPTGKQTPFHAEVYFINQTVQMAFKWGTDSRVNFIDPVTSIPLTLGASGEMNLQVCDSRKLLLKLVGTTGGLVNKQVLSAESNESGTVHKTLRSYFRAPLMTAIKSHLASTIKDQQINILEIDQHMASLSEELRERIAPQFEEYGLTIPQFYVTNISLPEDDKNFQDIRAMISRAYFDVKAEQVKAQTAQAAQQRKIIEAQTEAQLRLIQAQGDAEAQKLLGLSEAEVMRAKGYTQKDVLDADVQKAFAAGMGQMGSNGGGNGGSGIGTDLVGMVAQMKIAETMMEKFNFPGMSTPAPVTAPAPAPVATPAPAPAPAPAAATWTCPECGEDGNTKKFCMNCGKPKPEPKVEPEGWTCPDCGHTGNKGKFCEECGIPKPAATWDCPTCGEKDIKGKFCPECGTKRA